MFFVWRCWNKRSKPFPTDQVSSCFWSHWSFSFWFWRWRRLHKSDLRRLVEASVYSSEGRLCSSEVHQGGPVVCKVGYKQCWSKGPSCVSSCTCRSKWGDLLHFYTGQPFFYGVLKHNCSSIDVTNAAAERSAVSAHQLRRCFEGEWIMFGEEKGASVCMSKGLGAVGNWGQPVSKNYPKVPTFCVSSAGSLWRRMFKKILDSTNFSFRRIEKLVLFWIFFFYPFGKYAQVHTRSSETNADSVTSQALEQLCPVAKVKLLCSGEMRGKNFDPW